MQTRLFITFECDCGETIKNGLLIFHDEKEIPAVSWDTASCSEFTCSCFDKTNYTGDFEYMNEDEI